MGNDREATKGVLRTIWASETDPTVALDEECSPTKVCRNMQGVTFDGYGDDSTDLTTAWRERLQHEGKYDASAGTVRDLVLGSDNGS
ncbi:hypothetical protein [Nitriliruptor alkaliphilus]|uniref:hypothetical protein n=1 Tax=Nitriliruptor alkaliphilus TaxID=427918 RepID=UPI0012EDF950|nr:hypothetical protein [Nitriliruptor alkaliphilus]